MKRRKTLAFAIMALSVMSTASVMNVYASESWIETEGGWQYQNADGSLASAKWAKSGELWYYLGDDGTILTDAVIDDGTNLYYVDGQGCMVTDQWRQVYSDDGSSYWNYFGSDGKAARKKGNSFRKKINDKTYIFDEDGKMLTGYINSDGGALQDASDPFIDTKYYAGEDGALYTEQWLCYGEHGGSDGTSTLAGISYYEYDSMWMYFDENGKKVAGTDSKILQKNINGQTYGFDENGIMMNWWGDVATTSSAAKYYSGYDGGQLLKDTWVWMYPSEELASAARHNKTDYEEMECSWWRTDSNGRVYKNKIKQINGKKYAFDDIGRMQTGFVLYNGTVDYVAQYDVDMLQSRHFIEGNPDEFLGVISSDIYLFGPNELNDGAMLAGNDIKVQLNDGVFTFGFERSGKAIGSRNHLTKRNNAYYINGLRLDASEETGYGVVYDGSKYYAVDENGKIVKGDKKVLKVGDEEWLILIKGEVKAYHCGEKPRWHTKNGVTGYYEYDSSRSEKYGDLIADTDTNADLTGTPDGIVLYKNN